MSVTVNGASQLRHFADFSRRAHPFLVPMPVDQNTLVSYLSIRILSAPEPQSHSPCLSIPILCKAQLIPTNHPWPVPSTTQFRGFINTID